MSVEREIEFSSLREHLQEPKEMPHAGYTRGRFTCLSASPLSTCCWAHWG
jgi:hypothetical protein